MEKPSVRVEIVFRDCKHNTRISTVLCSDGLYDFDTYMYQAINGLGFCPDPGDKFEVISYKVFNLSFTENIPPLDPTVFSSKFGLKP